MQEEHVWQTDRLLLHRNNRIISCFFFKKKIPYECMYLCMYNVHGVLQRTMSAPLIPK